MIANFFSKSKPVNIFNLVVLLVLYYIISFIFINNEALIGWDFVINISLFLLLIVGLIVVNFIINKNNFLFKKYGSFSLSCIIALLNV